MAPTTRSMSTAQPRGKHAVAKQTSKSRVGKKKHSRRTSIKSSTQSSTIQRSCNSQGGEQSLCFLEALTAFQERRISEKEYFHNMLLHFTGIRHTGGRRIEGHDLGGDPVAQSIFDAALQDEKYQAPQSSELIEAIFAACLAGEHDQFIIHYEKLPIDLRHCLLVPLATLAGERRRRDVIRSLVKSSIKLDDEMRLKQVIWQFAFDWVEILDIFWQENWIHMQQDMRRMDFLTERTAVGKSGKAALVLQWLIDHGAGVPGNTWRYLMHQSPHLDVLRVLLKANARKVLTSGLFQVRIGEGDIATVKLLLDAGVNVNGVPPSMGDERESGPNTALWMAVGWPHCPYKDEHLEIARLLLDHGAKLNLPARPPGHTQTALEAARNRENGDTRMLRLFEEYIKKMIFHVGCCGT